jgi:protein phosphatase
MIPVSQAHMRVTATTDPGRRGKNNEDRYAVSAYILSDAQPVPALLAIVADGIGGHRAGEVAAEMAVENISRRVAASDAGRPLEILEEAFLAASQAIYAKAQSEDVLRGMGTTCACCWVIEDHLYTATVGDSRIYLIRNNAIRQLSTDHTWIQEAIDLGAITPAQAQNHPNMHIIRRFLGSEKPPQTDFRLKLSAAESDDQAEANQGTRLQVGDQLLICSDGLTDLVNPDEILSNLQKESGEKALARLVELANQRGGHDNITIVLIDHTAQPPAKPRRSRRNIFLTCLVISLLLLAIAVLLAGNWLWDFRFGPAGSTDTALPTANSALSSPPPGMRATPTQLDLPTTAPTSRMPTQEPVKPTSETPTLPLATLTPWPTNTP